MAVPAAPAQAARPAAPASAPAPKPPAAPRPAEPAKKPERARKTTEAPRIARKASGEAAKGLPVSHPTDPAEREATTMAARVMRAAVPGAADGGELAPMKPKESLTSPVARTPEASGAAMTADPALVGDLGPGSALDPETRVFFEQRFGTDLSQVRIHTDSRADRAAKSVEARAFTLGRNIAFASGLYAPETPEGRELLAHELVHVLQARDGLTRQVMRDGPAPTGTGDSEEIRLATPLGLPPNKSRHAPRYQALAAGRALKRPKNYNREDLGPDQVRHWNTNVNFDETDIRRAGHVDGTADPGTIVLHVAGPSGETSRLSELAAGREIITALKIPTWNKAGQRLVDSDRYDVDHIVELQVGGSDNFQNYELFRGANNRSVGGAIRGTILAAIRADLARKAADPNISAAFKARYPPTAAGVENLKTDKEVHFPLVENSGRDSSSARRRESTGAFWTRDEIAGLGHVSSLLIPPDRTADGTASRLALYSPTGQLKIGTLPHSGARNGSATIRIQGTNQHLISGLVLSSATISYGSAGQGPSGTLTATWDLDADVFTPGSVPATPMNIPLSPVAGKQHSAAFAWPSTDLNATVSAMSPIALTGIQVVHGRLDGRGMISPTLPFLDGIQLPARLQGGGLRLSHTVDVTRFIQRLRLPGVRVTDANLTLFIAESGAGAEGFAAFAIDRLGEGTLFVGISAAGSYELSGSFVFDPTLFDQASVNLRYNNEGFSATGTIGITRPNRIRGLRSASATVRYNSSTGFVVEGTAQPDIPGISSATLHYANGPESQQIEGAATLNRAPGIQGGTIGIKLTKRDADWKLAAQGEVTPDIPGITSQLTASYDDGALTLGGSASFQRGPFSGTVEVGATNRPIDPDGRILDGAPTNELKAYGSGEVTARLSDNLQGTVGIKRRPDGRILLSGRIGIPQSVEVFGRYPDPPWQRTLLTLPTVNIPIFGGGVGSFTIGIGATIGGALTATAYVGPGMLQDATIGIVDFDPINLSSLQVTGHARFVVPAYAGMRLGIDAGITGGAAIISVTGGMNVGAELGIQAQTVAEADLLWTPAEGLNLQATLSASVEPKLRFTVGAFVKADVSLLFTSFTIYRKDWQLAAFEYGPALRVGLSVPIAYRTGQGVVFDFNAIQFQLPSVTPRELIGGLLGSQGQEEKSEG